MTNFLTLKMQLMMNAHTTPATKPSNAPKTYKSNKHLKNSNHPVLQHASYVFILATCMCWLGCNKQVRIFLLLVPEIFSKSLQQRILYEPSFFTLFNHKTFEAPNFWATCMKTKFVFKQKADTVLIPLQHTCFLHNIPQKTGLNWGIQNILPMYDS